MQFVAGAAMFLSLACVFMMVVWKDYIQSVTVTLLIIAVSIYVTGNYIEIAFNGMEAASAGLMLRFMIVPFIPTLWYFCVREFCGLRFRKKRVILAFMVVPLFFAYLFFTWKENGLLISSVYYAKNNPNGNLIVDYGSLNWFRLLYQMTINFLGLFTIVRCYKNGTQRFQKQAILFIVSVLIPLFNSLSYFIQVGSYYIDITAYGLLLSTLCFTVLLYFFGVVNLTDVIKNRTMDHLNEGVVLLDKDGTFLEANQSARRIFPPLEQVPVGQDIRQMEFLPFHKIELGQEKQNSYVGEFTIAHGDINSTYNVTLSQIYRGTKIIGNSLIINNITPIKVLLSQMEEKSIKDPLTQIYNRGFLFEVGSSLLNKSVVNEACFSVIMMDIDFFKKVNDTYGHAYGDYVLRTIADLCTQKFRKTDIVARYGGEEFCILMPGTTLEWALKKADDVRVAIEQTLFEKDGIQLHVTVSMGVSSNNGGESDLEQIINQADANLYISKKNGRNQVN